ncbi:MAG: GNAT family N-acetyltransferase [Roseicyclus sp.]|nr:GNAT family N-acetyltransferase [Roseicyclus sp.]MBO6626626.1 GNAT family N-acetyltransferase [Roseicyclus sp.]MBO6921856.1 GNAT family N-acetyltransferase [Roseicyclus sp.]
MTDTYRSAGGTGARKPGIVAELTLVSGFPEDQRERVARLYWQAFRGKLGRVLGPDDKALRFLTPVLHGSHAISALNADGALVGVAGFSTPQDTFVAGTEADLCKVYGRFGAMWRGLLLEMLDRPRSTEILVMDGIFVAPEARGQGVGSALLDGIVEEAKARGLAGVRLDVIDSNPRAKALYERKGFVACTPQKLGALKWVFGFSSVTPMIKPV